MVYIAIVMSNREFVIPTEVEESLTINQKYLEMSPDLRMKLRLGRRLLST